MTVARTQPRSLTRRPLDSGWTISATAGPVPAPVAGRQIPATVPGVVHLDLMAAGLIPDPYLDDNESLLSWIGLADWTYRTIISVTAEQLAAADRHELCFDGLDTVATVRLNCEVLAHVANQHRSYRLDVTDRLQDGDNVLEVAFRSPVKYANAQSIVLGARPRPYPTPFEVIRKSACSFGWDWGISTATSGIWRPVRLESWSTARLDQVLVHAEPDDDGIGGLVTIHLRVARAESVALVARVAVADVTATASLPAGRDDATIAVHVPVVDRWWPAGHGDQPLYDVNLRLETAGVSLDAGTRRVGFRSLRWDTEPDATGAPFQLVVNDRPIYVKGVNWIPDDAFPTRVDSSRYARRLEQAKAANVNLIRVWGGGIYESDAFYDLCDELGLLTWQDFLFACAAYPEDPVLRDQVEAEARDNVSRIGHHASLAMMAGNNENLWAYEDWGWQQVLDGRSWGALYYHELLPGVVAEQAPHVPYTPGSPFSPGGQHPNDAAHGSMHLWEQWNTLDWRTYRTVAPRFVAEFGWQGPPTWSTLTRSVSDDPLTPESPGMAVHQKAAEGHAKLVRGLVPHYRVPDEMETWHWAMQLNQANAVSCALDWFRSLAPHNAGAIVWQLNDCWPVTSWSAIDGDGHEKPLYFALQNSFAPRLVTVQPRGGERLAAFLVNDTDEPWSGDAIIARRTLDGAVLATTSTPVTVRARETVELPLPAAVALPRESAHHLVVVEAMGERGLWFPSEARDSALAAPRMRVEVHEVDGGADVTVVADVLLRDLTLLIDKLDSDATVDRGLVTLLPGESATFHVHGVQGLTSAAVQVPGILRSGNELVQS